MSTTMSMIGARQRGATDLGAAIWAVVARAARERRVRRDIAFLMDQDERMLSDIGLTRGDIARALRGRR